jgi:YVTN family beta-propeller protein
MGRVWVIDTATDRVTDTIRVGRGPAGVAVSPDGTRAYVTVAHNRSVAVIDTATDQVTVTIDVHSVPETVAVSPDGTRTYVTDADSPGSVSVIDTGTCHRHHPQPR